MLGIVIAFQDYKPWLGIGGSPWVGLEHFRFLFTYPDSKLVLKNTIVIASLKLVFNLIVPLVFALLLNEVRAAFFKRTVQTLVYLPYFLSWVIIGGIMIDMLSIDGGIVSAVSGMFVGKMYGNNVHCHRFESVHRLFVNYAVTEKKTTNEINGFFP